MIDVIGAGLPRTGTLSLRTALETLGFAPCYHMAELMDHPEHAPAWIAAARGTGSWETVFDGYRATVDFPGAAVWRTLSEVFPDAKVILSVRDPRRWYASMQKTILPRVQAAANGQGPTDPTAAVVGDVMTAILRDRPSELLTSTEAEAVEAFERHTAEVTGTVPPDRLLTFEASQGWEPLCAFLEVPVPDEPYPHLNDTTEFQERFGRRIAAEPSESSG